MTFPDINSRTCMNSTNDATKRMEKSDGREKINKRKLRHAILNNKLISNESNTENTDNSIIPDPRLGVAELKEIKEYLDQEKNKNDSISNRMNIVNNLYPSNIDNNIEINFSQYEIKILPDQNNVELNQRTSNEDDKDVKSDNGKMEIIKIFKKYKCSENLGKYTDKDEDKVSQSNEKNVNKLTNYDKQLSFKSEKKLSTKNLQNNSHPAKIFINRSNSKNIVLNINNHEKIDSLNIKVNQSCKTSNEDISINFKKSPTNNKDNTDNKKILEILNNNEKNNEENYISDKNAKMEKTNQENLICSIDSHNKSESDSNSSLEIIKRNKQQFLDRRIILKDSDDESIKGNVHNLNNINTLNQINTELDSAKNNMEESNTNIKLINHMKYKGPKFISNSSKNSKIIFPDLAKQLNDQKSFNKRGTSKIKSLNNKKYIRQLTRISEISNKFSNSNNSNESGKRIKKRIRKNSKIKENFQEYKNLNENGFNIRDEQLIKKEEINLEENKENDHPILVFIAKKESTEIYDEINLEKMFKGSRPEDIKNLQKDSDNSDSFDKSLTTKFDKEDKKNFTSLDLSDNKKSFLRSSTLNSDVFKNILHRSLGSLTKNPNSFCYSSKFDASISLPSLRDSEIKRRYSSIGKSESNYERIKNNLENQKIYLKEDSLKHIVLKIENFLQENFRKKRLKKLYKKLFKGFKVFNGISSILEIQCNNTEDDNFVLSVTDDEYNICTKKQFSDYCLNKYYHIDPLQNILVDEYLFDDFELPNVFKLNKNTLIENFSLLSTKHSTVSNYNNSLIRKKFCKNINNKNRSCTYMNYFKKNNIIIDKIDLGKENLIFFNKFLQLDFRATNLDKSNESIKINLNFPIKFNKRNSVILEEKFLRKNLKFGTVIAMNVEEKIKRCSSNALLEVSKKKIPFFGNDLFKIGKKLTLFKTNIKVSSPVNETEKKRKQSEYTNEYFPKKFSVLSHNDYLFDINVKTRMIDNDHLQGLKMYLSKRRLTLLNSPLNSLVNSFQYKLDNEDEFNSNPTISTNTRQMNKESMLFRTHEIKSRLLKSNNNDTKLSLFFYIKDNNFHKFKEILDNKKTLLEEKDNDGNTLLNLAVQCNSHKIVEYLINIGANVNTQNNILNTPLHYALYDKHFKLADMLLKRNADENLKNKSHLSPWQCISNLESIHK